MPSSDILIQYYDLKSRCMSKMIEAGHADTLEEMDRIAREAVQLDQWANALFSEFVGRD